MGKRFNKWNVNPLAATCFVVVLRPISVQFSSLPQSCPTFCDPVDCSKPAFPVHHCLPEFPQTHVHRVGDAVVPFSCLQSFPASGSLPVSQFFTSGGQNIGVSASAPVLPVNIQDWYPLGFTWVWSPCSPRDSQESSPTSQFKSIHSSVLIFLYSPTLSSIHDYWKNHSLD